MPAARRRVIHLTPYYPPHLGGVERVAEALARGLSCTHDVEVWTSDLDGGCSGTSGPPVGNVPVRRLPAVEIGHTPVAPRLIRLLFTLPSDCVVHVHVAQALWPELVVLAAAWRRFQVVAHFHLDVDPTGPTGFLLPLYEGQFLARSLRRADAVIALTDAQARFLVDHYRLMPDQVHVLPNGVDDTFFTLGRHRSRSDDPLRVLFVGRFERQKNVPRLLRALAVVPEPVEVVLVGEGSERGRCQALGDALGLDGVRFVGPQHAGALTTWYQWADVFVLASDREGMPLALLEAMASGLAVVATDVSDLAEQVGDAGLVVPPDDESLAAALTTLTRDRDLLARFQCRARARAHHWDAVVAELVVLYGSLPA